MPIQYNNQTYYPNKNQFWVTSKDPSDIYFDFVIATNKPSGMIPVDKDTAISLINQKISYLQPTDTNSINGFKQHLQEIQKQPEYYDIPELGMKNAPLDQVEHEIQARGDKNYLSPEQFRAKNAQAQPQIQGQQPGQFQQPASGLGSVAETNRLLGGQYFDPATGKQLQQFVPGQPYSSPNAPGGATGGVSGQGGTGQPQGQTTASTGDPALDAILGQLSDQNKQIFNMLKLSLDQIRQNGQVVNPAITEITPEMAAEFMKTAEAGIKEFLPYAEKEKLPLYQQQLQLARADLLRNAGYDEQQLLRTEQDLERRYQESQRQIGESAAERGFALSGIRQREEGQLATQTQRQIEEGRSRLSFLEGGRARQFASQYGTANLPEMQIPNAPQIGSGTFGKPSGTQPLYQLSDDVYKGLVGSEDLATQGAIKSRAAELEGAFREQQGINQQRKLNRSIIV